MTDELLRHPIHSGHITVTALKRHKDKPVLFLGDTTLTGGQLAERISQYIQAFEALGAGTGSISGLLSLNRPEVLMIIGASRRGGIGARHYTLSARWRTTRSSSPTPR
jgi:fatty-acyl-CoA synthase